MDTVCIYCNKLEREKRFINHKNTTSVELEYILWGIIFHFLTCSCECVYTHAHAHTQISITSQVYEDASYICRFGNTLMMVAVLVRALG